MVITNLLKYNIMRTKPLFYAAFAALMLAGGCSDGNEPEPGPNGGGNEYPDPEGTVVLSMYNSDNGKTLLGDSGIFIDRDNRFTGGRFVSLGEMKGVADIGEIPVTGWTESVPVVNGAGYVAYSDVQKRFYRFHVSRLLGTDEAVTGAEIKYLTPFYGADEPARPESETVTFGSEGGSRELGLANSSAAIFTVEAEGCSAEVVYSKDYPFLPAGVRITAEPNPLASVASGRVVLTTAYGSETEIEVRISGGEPYMAFEPAEFSVTHAGGSRTVVLATNVDLSTVTVESSSSWFRAETADTPGEYVVTVDVNGTEGAREGILTASVPDGSAKAELRISQDFLEYTLSAEALDFGRKASEQTFSVLPVDLVPTAESADDWCTCEVFSNVVTVKVGDNGTGADRTTTVTVSVDGVERTLEVRQGRYAIGDYYDVEGVQGIVYEVEGFHGGIVSIEVSHNVKWSTEYAVTDATDESDGMNNMNVIKGRPDWINLYPAFAWCEAKNTGGVTGWYLPSVDEVKKICAGHVEINAGLEARGGDLLTNGHYYWTSTEANEYSAKYVQFLNGFLTQYYKKDDYSVRAVRAY